MKSGLARASSADKLLEDPNGCQRVQCTIGPELRIQLRPACARSAGMDRLEICNPRRVTFLDPFEISVIEIRGDCREEFLDAPASLLRGMVIALPGDLQKIDHPRRNSQEPSLQVRKLL